MLTALLLPGTFPASSGSLGATQEEAALLLVRGRMGRTLQGCLGCRQSKPMGFRFSSLAVPSDPRLRDTAQPRPAPQPQWTEEAERNVLGSE